MSPGRTSVERLSLHDTCAGIAVASGTFVN